MGKVAQRYLKVDPWKVIEEGFHLERSQVSESIFSLANEYHGIRGSFDEGGTVPSLRGSYFNGVYEYGENNSGVSYKGIIKQSHFMINSVDWTKLKLIIDGETLDLGKNTFENFYRELDLKSGLYTRKFTWVLSNRKRVHLTFKRLLSMNHYQRAYQVVEITAEEDVNVVITFSLNNKIVHWGKINYYRPGKNFFKKPYLGTVNKTLTTGQSVASLMYLATDLSGEVFEDGMEVGVGYAFKIQKNETRDFTKYVVNYVDKNHKYSLDELLDKGLRELETSLKDGYHQALKDNQRYWEEVYAHSDIEIVGDPINQQGIRYNIFQLEQTYHGINPAHNIGAKGLTGEAYSGHAFWDSETYCFPYYLLNNLTSAKNLLLFRYSTLPQALDRARQLDCEGACYPIATLNGEEGSGLWQHASLQFQPSTAVAYAVYHYVNVSRDENFLVDYGLEMLMQISKFLYSRGQWNGAKTHFGYYAVMGPDEFQMMVNHNTYTNIMAKITLEYTLETLEKFKNNPKVKALVKHLEFSDEFQKKIKNAAEKMLILYDEKTKIYEQHLGFYDLPHIDPHEIKEDEFPLYSHWSYDRIFRNDMIKQPDVLMFIFLYSQRFSFEVKKANYDFYEPKTIHESSLSPSVHSILATELGYHQQALDFFGFATRMDLDDYNRNTSEGLHMTSVAAAFMNIVYGFGGLRSDGISLCLAPSLPSSWEKFSFAFTYLNKRLKVAVGKKTVTITSPTPDEVEMFLYDKKVQVKQHLEVTR